MPGGRPTSYDPAFCDVAVEFLGRGYSTTALAGEIGVARTTIYNWADEHPEFLNALKSGQAAGARWWEDRLADVGRDGGAPGQATAIIFALKNRAALDWREKTEVDHTSSDGTMTPQPTRIELVAPSVDHGEG